MRLAAEGDEDSVNFLLEKFNASINFAVRGAASTCHVNLTNRLIERGGSIDYAVWGAAYGGHDALVNLLIARHASMDFAIYGAASGNQVKLSYELMRGGELGSAVYKDSLWRAYRFNQ